MNLAYTLLPPAPEAQASAAAITGPRHAITRAGAAIRRALEASGRARAERHLLDFAEQCEAQQPELAKELRAAARQAPLP